MRYTLLQFVAFCVATVGVLGCEQSELEMNQKQSGDGPQCIEVHDDVRFAAGPIYTGRIFGGDVGGLRHGLGAASTLVFRVTDRQAENSAVYLGPRFHAEHLWGQGAEDNRALFTLGLEVRWVTFDTTRSGWF